MKRGQWQVERERLHVADYKPQTPFKEPDSIEDIIPRLMTRLGLANPHWVSVLNDEWETIVGKAVGSHTRPGRISGKCLIVFVDSSSWLSELSRYGKKEMLTNLQSRFGSGRIKSLSLKLDPDVTSK